MYDVFSTRDVRVVTDPNEVSAAHQALNNASPSSWTGRTYTISEVTTHTLHANGHPRPAAVRRFGSDPQSHLIFASSDDGHDARPIVVTTLDAFAQMITTPRGLAPGGTLRFKAPDAVVESNNRAEVYVAFGSRIYAMHKLDLKAVAKETPQKRPAPPAKSPAALHHRL